MTESYSTARLPHLTSWQSKFEWRSLSMAAFVHLLLLAFLWFGVQWQNNHNTAVDAEIWDLTAREAAPVEKEVLPAPEIEPITPAVVVPPPAKLEVREEPDPEIIIEQEKKRKIVEKKKLDEQRLAEKVRKEEKIAEQKLQAQLLKEAEIKAQAKLQKNLQDQADKKKLADQKQLQSKDQAAKDKIFAENMRRLSGQASTTGAVGSGGTGDAAKSTGNNRGDASYAAKIAAKVRSNTVFNSADNSSNNPTVEYRIDLLPDGSLRGAPKKLKSSGILAFDEAVEKGIEKSQPFPRDKSGEVQASMVLVYKLKE